MSQQSILKYRYNLDSIIIDKDSDFAIINDGKIIQSDAHGFKLNYYYNDDGYMNKIVNPIDSVNYIYFNGNLIQRNEYTFADLEARIGKKTIETKYEYYDSLVVTENDFIYFMEEFNTISFCNYQNFYFRYLGLFGHHSKNLIKSKTIEDMNTHQIWHLTYHWKIENRLIKELEIEMDSKVHWKVVYWYY